MFFCFCKYSYVCIAIAFFSKNKNMKSETPNEVETANSINGLRIREGYEAEPLALGSFLLYAVIGCPSLGMIINNLNNIK